MNITEVQQLKTQISDSLKTQNTAMLKLHLRKLRAYTATKLGLRQTTIGIFINELKRDHNVSKEIKDLCKTLILKWKSDVGTNSNTTSSQQVIDSPINSPSTTNSTSTPIQDRTISSDNLFYKSTSHKGKYFLSHSP
jgi:oligoendopeptidase F